jgi:hypothetical protein
VADLEDGGPDRETLAVVQHHVGRRGRIELEPEPAALFRQAVIERAIGGMEVDRGAGGPVHRGQAGDVIQVGVGEPDRGDPAAPPIRFGEEPLGLLSRIDQHGLGCAGVVDQVAVLGERAVGKRNDLQRLKRVVRNR